MVRVKFCTPFSVLDSVALIQTGPSWGGAVGVLQEVGSRKAAESEVVRDKGGGGEGGRKDRGGAGEGKKRREGREEEPEEERTGAAGGSRSGARGNPTNVVGGSTVNRGAPPPPPRSADKLSDPLSPHSGLQSCLVRCSGG